GACHVRIFCSYGNVVAEAAAISPIKGNVAPSISFFIVVLLSIRYFKRGCLISYSFAYCLTTMQWLFYFFHFFLLLYKILHGTTLTNEFLYKWNNFNRQ